MFPTGDLSIPRQHALELAVAAGCNVSSNVNRRTTLLVSGLRDASQYNGKSKSGKILKAEELIAEGFPLRIINEDEFMNMVNAGDHHVMA